MFPGILVLSDFSSLRKVLWAFRFGTHSISPLSFSWRFPVHSNRSMLLRNPAFDEPVYSWFFVTYQMDLITESFNSCSTFYQLEKPTWRDIGKGIREHSSIYVCMNHTYAVAYSSIWPFGSWLFCQWNASSMAWGLLTVLFTAESPAAVPGPGMY